MIHGLVTVRTTSTRLPAKCLLPFGDGINIIEHVILRAKYYDIDPILCTSTDKTDDILIEIAKKYKIKYFRGALVNKLKRWSDCAEHFKINHFHSVDADDPFFDGEEMHKSMSLLLKDDYDIICPTISSSNGSASVGYSLTSNIIKKALIGINEDCDTEMMWYSIDKVENVKKCILDDFDNNTLKARLTLDYQEDYWLLSTIQKILGNSCSRNEINKLFKENPDLYKINWFRNAEWKNAQDAKKI